MLLQQRNRRVFLADVARGMLVAGVGLGTALDLGLTKTRAEEAAKPRLSFGALDPLVGMMQQTPAASLVPQLVDALKNGTSLRDLLTAGALANARSFGGGDYIGYHTLMALGPAWLMSQEAPAAEQALPVFKVLYRNTARIQDSRAFEHEALQPVVADRSAGTVTGEMLRDAVRQHDMARAEAQFATLADQSPQAAFNELLYAVQDETEVHRVALPYRAYALIDLIGAEHAQTLLRQSLRYCVNAENWNRKSTYGDVRVLLPKLFDQHRLAGRTAGDKPAEDAWIEQFVQLLFTSTPEQAAEATAAALAEGMLPEAVGEAISLAANQLVLRDQGRTGEIEQRGKPIGSVHGDSIGVHASDSANAWRNMARFSNARNQFACLILGAFQVARDRLERGGDFAKWPAYPLASQLSRVADVSADVLLGQAEDAIRNNLQAHVSAIVQRYGQLGFPEAPLFSVLLKFATSEDGALHAEKYYATVREEFAATRPAFRWRHLVGLARVTASEFGRPAAGYAEARRLLNLPG